MQDQPQEAEDVVHYWDDIEQRRRAIRGRVDAHSDPLHVIVARRSGDVLILRSKVSSIRRGRSSLDGATA